MTIDRFISLWLGILELGRWDGSTIIVWPPINDKQQVLRTVLNGTLHDWQQIWQGQARRPTDAFTGADFEALRQCQFYNFRAYPERYRRVFSRAAWIEAEKAAIEALRLIRTEYHLERI